jgi:ketosteroid isomerase-like protein
MRVLILLIAGITILLGCSNVSRQPNTEDLKQQVIETERAFAATMANRDFTAFKTFVSSEAVFFSGAKPLRGAQQVADWWRRYYKDSTAPFSWQPDKVEVLDSGTLALSTGPVFDGDGKLISTFTSIWRLEAPGHWRIIFDKGNKVCD